MKKEKLRKCMKKKSSFLYLSLSFKKDHINNEKYLVGKLEIHKI